MSLTKQTSFRPRLRMRQARIALGAIGITFVCTLSHGQAPATQAPQLYLTNDTFPKKGYIEKSDSNNDDRVAFRVCATAEQIPVTKSSLKPIQGTCSDPNLPWNNVLTGAITAVRADGSIEIETVDKKTFSMTREEWEKGFKLQSHKIEFGVKPPTPTIGQLIGGTVHDTPRNLYVIDNAAMHSPSPRM